MRPYEVWRHTLGTPATDDVLVLREDDERFFVGVERTRSGRFVLIDASSKLTSEVWFVPTDAPDDRAARRSRRASPATSTPSSTTGARTHGDRFLIVTNQGGDARNFELVAAPCVDPGTRSTGRRSSRTATTSSSTRSTRSPTTSC